jgi:hypothetical protein
MHGPLPRIARRNRCALRHRAWLCATNTPSRFAMDVPVTNNQLAVAGNPKNAHPLTVVLTSIGT